MLVLYRIPHCFLVVAVQKFNKRGQLPYKLKHVLESCLLLECDKVTQLNMTVSVLINYQYLKSVS
jgi:hypothetical protein